MAAEELLARIRDLNINLWVEGDALCYSAPLGTLTQELREELSAHKTGIIVLLREAQVASSLDQSQEPEHAEAFVAPQTPIEEVLAEIWAEVLGVERVGICDNFFELGGDSLLGLRVITKANQAGLQFIPQQLLEHQTIAELAAVEGTVLVQSEQGLVTGPVPLTPAQYALIAQEYSDLNWGTVRMLFEVPQIVTPMLLRQVVRSILWHHDALRARFVRDEAGWQQFIVDPNDFVPFIYIDLSDLAVEAHASEIEAIARQLRCSLDLSVGPLLRVVLFDRGACSRRLLIVMSHLVTDGVSQSILLEDFQLAYLQLSRKERIRLPPKTTSVKQWGGRLSTYARSAQMRQELDYWLGLPWERVPLLPVDYPTGRNTRLKKSSLGQVQASLTIEETRVLLQEILAAYDVRVTDVLLMALVHTLTDWTGGRWAQISVVNNGRTAIPNADDIDLSRTVGDLVCHGLLVLKREEAHSAGDALRSIKEQLLHIPNQGLGYPILRHYGGAEISEKLAPLFNVYKDVLFNFTDGYQPNNQSSNKTSNDSGLIRRAQEPIRMANPREKDITLLRCKPFLVGGQLGVDWRYNTNIHVHTTIEKVAQGFLKALRDLIECS